MASVVEICNLALNHIGAKTISSIDEASEIARRCKLIYEPLRDAVLRDHAWNFATASEQLAVLNETLPGWLFLYAQPSNCINVRRVFNTIAVANPANQDFKILLSPDTKTKSIAANLEASWCEFTYKVTDPNVFDPKFIEALSYRMGASLAQPLAGNILLGQALLQMSVAITEKAVLQNAREGSQQKPIFSSLIEAR
jgi:hypothetical protein